MAAESSHANPFGLTTQEKIAQYVRVISIRLDAVIVQVRIAHDDTDFLQVPSESPQVLAAHHLRISHDRGVPLQIDEARGALAMKIDF